MNIQFNILPHQTEAVDAVVQCFDGQPPVPAHSSSAYTDAEQNKFFLKNHDLLGIDVYPNAEIAVSQERLKQNIAKIQRQYHLPDTTALDTRLKNPLHIDVEMETGTGKTYCYIKTIFELNKKYGWRKFIIVVPSIAIREGVAQSLKITADHFRDSYKKTAKFFIYNSKQLHELNDFSSDPGIHVMIINMQAFNTKGKDHRRIYEELDSFGSRQPMQLIAATRPILILDEPQKIGEGTTLKALEDFNALMLLRYSATHKSTQHKVYKLDALDAYQRKLVKKIAVRGISIHAGGGFNAYLYLQSIEYSKDKPPQAVVEFEQKLKSGEIKRVVRKLKKSDNLFELSGELEQYRHYIVSDIANKLSFSNGVQLNPGTAYGDVGEDTLRRIQIRETIAAHFQKERNLFQQGYKVLSLFFIDQVVKYRDYAAADGKGVYARIFEEEYQRYLDYLEQEVWQEDEMAYRRYFNGISAAQTHNGYFSIDKRSRRLIDPKIKGTEADDVDAYDLILKDKERLLSFDEPVRFIFSHSALREGWDNPNVFVICPLKHSNNMISRRQEVGRGLRLSVDQQGRRVENEDIVHEINVLTVVANESYESFVTELQKEINASLLRRSMPANEGYFTNKWLKTPSGEISLTPQLAKQLYRYLIKNNYNDENDCIITLYQEAQKQGTLAPLPDELEPYASAVHELINSCIYHDAQSIQVDNERSERKNRRNSNFNKPEFKALWDRIDHKAIYSVAFDSAELVEKAIQTLNKELRVPSLSYSITSGQQDADGAGFECQSQKGVPDVSPVFSSVKYDLVGKVAQETRLTRRTTVDILKGMDKEAFKGYERNPERFITEVARLISEQKNALMLENLSYEPVAERFGLKIFPPDLTAGVEVSEPTQKHIYDYVSVDSGVERQFAKDLDASAQVQVYAKLPRSFSIPTPVGCYTLDWAVSFAKGQVQHLYFVVETKGSDSAMALTQIELAKTKCARKFFEAMNAKYSPQHTHYEVVSSFEKLMVKVQAVF